jgi:F-type H+-transporting ATPase subunit alpha
MHNARSFFIALFLACSFAGASPATEAEHTSPPAVTSHEINVVRQVAIALAAGSDAVQDLRGKRIMEIFKQPQYNPIPVDVQVAVIWAMQNGYLDQVPVDRVKEFQTKFTEFLTTRKVELLAKIDKEKALSDALTADLKAVADEFKQTWK